jgi:hypothetical protein
MNHVMPLLAGPLDIVGDVHGEIEALRDLFRVLGYSPDGVHSQGRRLVFIGDLTDRGPDSPAVIGLVSGLVARGLAQCVLGNHELYLLRQARKEGNGWFFQDDHDRRKNSFLDSRAADGELRTAIRAFVAALPIALERPDLRLVHASWHAASIASIRRSPLTMLELYDRHHEYAVQLGIDTGLAARAAAEEVALGDHLVDQHSAVPLLPGLGALDALHRDANPVSIVTSGLERIAQRVYFASGKWRMVDRFRWWTQYQDPIPVIVGHYWRWPTPAAQQAYSRGEPGLFDECAVNGWFGAQRNVFCVDFAVGARYKERAAGATDRFQCRLGAVRWPERELVFDDGTTLPMVGG